MEKKENEDVNGPTQPQSNSRGSGGAEHEPAKATEEYEQFRTGGGNEMAVENADLTDSFQELSEYYDHKEADLAWSHANAIEALKKEIDLYKSYVSKQFEELKYAETTHDNLKLELERQTAQHSQEMKCLTLELARFTNDLKQVKGQDGKDTFDEEKAQFCQLIIGRLKRDLDERREKLARNNFQQAQITSDMKLQSQSFEDAKAQIEGEISKLSQELIDVREECLKDNSGQFDQVACAVKQQYAQDEDKHGELRLWAKQQRHDENREKMAQEISGEQETSIRSQHGKLLQQLDTAVKNCQDVQQKTALNCYDDFRGQYKKKLLELVKKKNCHDETIGLLMKYFKGERPEGNELYLQDANDELHSDIQTMEEQTAKFLQSIQDGSTKNLALDLLDEEESLSAIQSEKVRLMHAVDQERVEFNNLRALVESKIDACREEEINKCNKEICMEDVANDDHKIVVSTKELDDKGENVQNDVDRLIQKMNHASALHQTELLTLEKWFARDLNDTSSKVKAQFAEPLKKATTGKSIFLRNLKPLVDEYSTVVQSLCKLKVEMEKQQKAPGGTTHKLASLERKLANKMKIAKILEAEFHSRIQEPTKTAQECAVGPLESNTDQRMKHST